MKRRYKSTTVIIATHKRAQLLEQCLSSLENQIVEPDEVIIVENGAKDETSRLIKNFRKLKIIYLYQKKANIPKARNLGLKQANGEIILMTDDDCLPSKNWVESAINSHNQNPSATIIQGHTISIPKKSIYSLFIQAYRDERIKIGQTYNQELIYCDTNNISMKSAKLKKLNVCFNEKIFYGSDKDFAAQIIAKKEKIVFDKKIVAYHKERSTIFKFLLQRFERGTSPVLLKKKWSHFESNHSKTNLNFDLKILFSLEKKLFNKKMFLENISLLFIAFLAYFSFKLGFLYQRLIKKLSHH